MPIKKGGSDKVVKDYEKSGTIGKIKPKSKNSGVVRTVKKRDGNYPVKIY